MGICRRKACVVAYPVLGPRFYPFPGDFVGLVFGMGLNIIAGGVKWRKRVRLANYPAFVPS